MIPVWLFDELADLRLDLDDLERRLRTRSHVIAAVEAGRLPRGGPSDAAAHNLLDDLPAGYWERWGAAAAERIRAQAQRPRCCCVDGPQPSADGRCGRCYGYPDDDARRREIAGERGRAR